MPERSTRDAFWCTCGEAFPTEVDRDRHTIQHLRGEVARLVREVADRDATIEDLRLVLQGIVNAAAAYRNSGAAFCLASIAESGLASLDTEVE